MAIDFKIAAQQINRLSSLPYFSALPDSGKMELINAMSQEARSDDEAKLAISALLADTARAGTVETNRVPSPGEIRVWLQAQRDDKYDSPTSSRTQFCGELKPGKTYLSHHPKTECTVEEVNLQATPPKFLIPSSCVRGWVHWTVWIPVVPERIDDDGRPITQPYEFSGRCKCQPGGTA